MNVSSGERAMRVAKIKALIVQDSVSSDSSSALTSNNRNSDTNGNLRENIIHPSDSLYSSIRQPKYSSPTTSKSQHQSFVRTPKRSSKKHLSKDQVAPSKTTLKGRLSKVSDSVACIACVAGYSAHESHEDDGWSDGNRAWCDESPALTSKKTKKVAFLLDQYTEDPILNGDRSDAARVSTSEKVSNANESETRRRSSSDETNDQDRYDRYNSQQTYPVSTGTLSRVQTNALAFVESINQDAGFWLRGNSFVDESNTVAL